MTATPELGARVLTIGQVARYARVTVKAVRVYHQRGLLPEPPRDSSGYRRYGAQDAIDLVRIRTLAQAGVPLARIRELLAATPAELDAALTEIDRTLRRRVEDIERVRRRLGRLRAGDRLFVSREVAEYLIRLRRLGISERAVRMERDGWILLQSVAPRQAAAFIADKLDAINDSEFRGLYVEYDAAWDWAPEDPRVLDLAERTRRWFASRRTGAGRTTPALDPTVVPVVNELVWARSPAWARALGATRERPD